MLWNLLYTRGPVAVEILFPARFVLLSKFMQHIPIVQTGVVSVIEKDLDCILADWGNIDVLFSGSQHGKCAGMRPDLGLGRVHPQVFKEQVKLCPFLVNDLEGFG